MDISREYSELLERKHEQKNPEREKEKLLLEFYERASILQASTMSENDVAQYLVELLKEYQALWNKWEKK
jgi:hypothetical protein